MAQGPEEWVELRSSKVQLEVGLIYLKRRYAQMEKQKALLEQGAGGREAAVKLAQLTTDLEAVARDVAAREATIRKLTDQIEQGERQAREGSVEELVAANDGLAAELAGLRADILQGLRALAGPLRSYQEAVDRKSRLVRRIAAMGERDLSYPNYLDCALLRQDGYDDDLRFVVEALKRQRVVS